VLVYLLVSNAASTAVVGPRTGVSAPGMRTAYLALTAVCSAIFLVCRRSPLTNRVLRALDVGGFFALAAGMVCVCLASDDPQNAPATLRVAGVFLILSRAGLLPSTGRRTAMASFGTAIILALGVLPLPAVVGHSSLYYAFASFRVQAVAAVLATSTSHTIYGLRRQVEEARRLGQYVLEDVIGQGGMGRVYRARHALLRRDTAIKLLLPEQVGEAAIRRFEREVQATARLTHPSTVVVYDYGRTSEGVFYYAMELLDGGDLDDLVAYTGALPARRVVFILEQICGALEAVVLRCLAKRPAERFADAATLGEALRDCTEGPRWDQAEARAWWAEHGARLRARRDERRVDRAGSKPTPFEAGTQVAVDARGRAGRSPDQARPRPAA